jgi:hypothetical protein
MKTVKTSIKRSSEKKHKKQHHKHAKRHLNAASTRTAPENTRLEIDEIPIRETAEKEVLEDKKTEDAPEVEMERSKVVKIDKKIGKGTKLKEKRDKTNLE